MRPHGDRWDGSRSCPEDSAIGDLSFSEADHACFQRCMRALLSPLEHESADEWRATVNRAAGSLCGADRVTFQLPSPGVELLYSDVHDAAHLRRYVPLLGDRFRKALYRTADLQVCNRRMLWGDELEEYYASTYYNEFIVPARGFDMLCASTRVEGSRRPVTLYLHHGSRRGPRFGGRGIRLLRMLYPALQAGARTFQRFHARRKSLFPMLDAIDDCVCVFDLDARLLHRNAAYRKLSLGDSENAAVAFTAGELARGLAALCLARRSRGGSGPCRVARRLWVGSRTFLLEGSLLEGMGIGPRPCVLVTVRQDGSSAGAAEEKAVLPADAAERFDLTPRQAEVAALLARRLTNREVARQLRISHHTARHHAERVLAKLGIRSRRAVAAKLSGPGND